MRNMQNVGEYDYLFELPVKILWELKDLWRKDIENVEKEWMVLKKKDKCRKRKLEEEIEKGKKKVIE